MIIWKKRLIRYSWYRKDLTFTILSKSISRNILIIEKFLHFYYVEGEIGWNLRRRNSWIPRSRANALESPAELGFHLGDQGEWPAKPDVIRRSSVLVIASKIIVRRRISVLPAFFSWNQMATFKICLISQQKEILYNHSVKEQEFHSKSFFAKTHVKSTYVLYYIYNW